MSTFREAPICGSRWTLTGTQVPYQPRYSRCVQGPLGRRSLKRNCAMCGKLWAAFVGVVFWAGLNAALCAQAVPCWKCDPITNPDINCRKPALPLVCPACTLAGMAVSGGTVWSQFVIHIPDPAIPSGEGPYHCKAARTLCSEATPCVLTVVNNWICSAPPLSCGSLVIGGACASYAPGMPIKSFVDDTYTCD